MVKVPNSFMSKWNDWIMKIVSGDKVGIKINDEIGPYMCTYQGLSKGTPFPLCSFIWPLVH